MIETAEDRLRERIVEVTRDLAARGLNRGTAGNVSVRHDGGMLITPSAVPPDRLTPSGVVRIAADGPHEGRPSSEWPMHAAVYAAQPELGAVVHVHSPFATTLACMGRGVPPIHYMIAIAGGEIRCAPYEPFGTDALAKAAVEALADRRACLLAHHGLIAAGADLDDALSVTLEVEFLCELHWRALAAGGAQPLSTNAMDDACQRFDDYSHPESNG